MGNQQGALATIGLQAASREAECGNEIRFLIIGGHVLHIVLDGVQGSGVVVVIALLNSVQLEAENGGVAVCLAKTDGSTVVNSRFQFLLDRRHTEGRVICTIQGQHCHIAGFLGRSTAREQDKQCGQEHRDRSGVESMVLHNHSPLLFYKNIRLLGKVDSLGSLLF